MHSEGESRVNSIVVVCSLSHELGDISSSLNPALEFCCRFEATIGAFVERDTLIGLDWTSGLDQYFIANNDKLKNDPDVEDILWQYFGSQEGFVRNYPANQWPQRSGVSTTKVKGPSPLHGKTKHIAIRFPSVKWDTWDGIQLDSDLGVSL